MPIFRFAKISEYKNWISKIVTPKRYIIVVTENNEVIAEPIKATRPLLFGHMQITAEKDRKDLIKELEEAGFNIFYVKDFSYDTERPPGTRITVE